MKCHLSSGSSRHNLGRLRVETLQHNSDRSLRQSRACCQAYCSDLLGGGGRINSICDVAGNVSFFFTHQGQKEQQQQPWTHTHTHTLGLQKENIILSSHTHTLACLLACYPPPPSCAASISLILTHGFLNNTSMSPL